MFRHPPFFLSIVPESFSGLTCKSLGIFRITSQLYCILLQSSTLIIHLNFLQVVLSLLFIAWKVAKAPGRDKISRLFLLLASCFATSLGRHKLATSNLSAVCRVLRIALRTAILKKYNCRTAFERTSHNGLQTSGFSVVILTLPVSLWYYHCTR